MCEPYECEKKNRRETDGRQTALWKNVATGGIVCDARRDPIYNNNNATNQTKRKIFSLKRLIGRTHCTL